MGTCRMAYGKILLFFYSVIQQFLRILLCISPILDPNNWSISSYFLLVWYWSSDPMGSLENIRHRVLRTRFLLGFVFDFEQAIETTSAMDGWHSESLNRKSNPNILKKLGIHLTEITFAYKISLHTICIFLLDQEVSSPFTKSKEKPDG